MENQNEQTQQTQETQNQNQSQQSQPQQSNGVDSGVEKIMETMTSIMELKFKDLSENLGDRLTHFADDLRDAILKPTKEEIEEEKAAKRGGVF